MNYGDVPYEFIEEDKQYSNQVKEYLNKEHRRIMGFFGLQKLDKKVHIKFWDSIEEFRNFLEESAKRKVENWVVASHSTNRIDILSLKEMRKAQGYEDVTLNYLLKCMAHEFTHECHKQYADYESKPPLYVGEGLAVHLSGQYTYIDLRKADFTCALENLVGQKSTNYYNYYLLFKYITENYDHDYVLRVAKDNQFAEKEAEKLFSEAKSWLAKFKREEHDEMEI